MSPPHTFKEVVLDFIHTAIYVTFMLSACALFSKTWIEASGSGPRDVAKQLKDQQMVMAGHREASMYKELKCVIPTAAAFGSAILGLLSIAADLSGAIGKWNGYSYGSRDHLQMFFHIPSSIAHPYHWTGDNDLCGRNTPTTYHFHLTAALKTYSRAKVISCGTCVCLIFAWPAIDSTIENPEKEGWFCASLTGSNNGQECYVFGAPTVD